MFAMVNTENEPIIPETIQVSSNYDELNKLPYGVRKYRIHRLPHQFFPTYQVESGSQIWAQGFQWHPNGFPSSRSVSLEECEAWAVKNGVAIDFYDL